MSRNRNRHIVEGGEIFSGQRGVEMAAPRTFLVAVRLLCGSPCFFVASVLRFSELNTARLSRNQKWQALRFSIRC